MLFIFFVAIMNLAFGFALAMYLGGHYHTTRKFGLAIPLPFKSDILVAESMPTSLPPTVSDAVPEETGPEVSPESPAVQAEAPAEASPEVPAEASAEASAETPAEASPAPMSNVEGSPAAE